MAWTLNASTQGTYGATDPQTLVHTCSAATRLLTLTIFVNGNTTRTGGAPTYNSVPMTDSGHGFVVHTECGVEVWYLISPPTGSSYTVSVPNTNIVNCDLSVTSWEPSAGGAAYDNSNSATGTTANPSLSLTVGATGNLVVGALGSGYRNVPTAGTNFTLVHTYDAGNQTWGTEYDLAGSATPVTVAFGQSADDWGLIGIGFSEEAGVTVYYQSAAGTLTPSGTIAKGTLKNLVGALTPAGALAKKSWLALVGALTPAGDLSTTAKFIRAFAGSLTPTGTVATLATFRRAFDGALTFSGDVKKKTLKSLSGTITASGVATKKTLKNLAGFLTPTGLLDATKVAAGMFYQSLSGGLTFSGDLTKKTYKSFAGSLTPSGITTALKLGGLYFQSLAGSLTTSGTLSIRRNFFLALAGTFNSSGTIVKKTLKGLAGEMTAIGTLVKKTGKSFVGGLTLAGQAIKKQFISLSGSVNFTGAISSLKNPISAVGAIALTLPARSFDLTLKIRDFGLNLRRRVFNLNLKNRN